LGGVSDFVFGTSKTEVVGSGLYLGDFALGGQADLQSYADVKTTSSGFLGFGGGSNVKPHYSDISGQSEVAFQRIFDNLREGILGIGEALDRDIQAQVDAFKVSIGKISTSGKTGAEIEQALQEAISTQADKLAYAIFPDLVTKYAKLNEGYFESGIELNKIFKGLGLAGFYRYGPNQLSQFEDNIAIKITFNLDLGF
jgi:hypothetical protein